MTELTTSSRAKRPEFRNINAFNDLPGYRWPLASLVSGMHRASGLVMFLLMPFIVWMFDTSLSSEISFARFSAAFTTGIGKLQCTGSCGMPSHVQCTCTESMSAPPKFLNNRLINAGPSQNGS